MKSVSDCPHWIISTQEAQIFELIIVLIFEQEKIRKMKSKLTTKKERIQDLTSALRDLGIEKAKIVRHGRRSLSSSLEPLLYDFQPFCFKHLQFRAHDHRPMAVGQSILKDDFLLAEFSVVLVYGSIIHILQQIHHLITLLHDSFFSTALDK